MDERVDSLLSMRERVDLFLSLHLGEWMTYEMIFEGAGCSDKDKFYVDMYALRGRYEYEEREEDVEMRYASTRKRYVKTVRWYRFVKRKATKVPLFCSVTEKDEYWAGVEAERIAKADARKAAAAEGTDSKLKNEVKGKWNKGEGISSIDRDRPERLPWTEERRAEAHRQWQRMWRYIRTRRD